MTYPRQGCVDGTNGDHLVVAPPAIIAQEEIALAIEQLTAAIQETEGSVSCGLH